MFDAYQSNNNRWGLTAEAQCKVPIDQKAGTRVTGRLSVSNPEDGFLSSSLQSIRGHPVVISC